MTTLSDEKRSAISQCAEANGVSEAATRKWFQRGIPGKWHLLLLRTARERGLELVEDDLLKVTSRK